MEQSKNTTDDTLTEDLEAIINENKDWKMDINEEKLMEKLTIYIVNRDGKILTHGIQVGKNQEIKRITL